MRTKSHLSKAVLTYKHVRESTKIKCRKVKIKRHLLYAQNVPAFIVNTRTYSSTTNAINVKFQFAANAF